jgi:glycosyltransferase involved in cell wall biosynthesis
MRIAVWHNLPSGGGKRALYDHVRGLLALGHFVEAWCPPTAAPDFLPLRDLIQEHVVALEWPVPYGLASKLGITLRTQSSLRAMETHCRECARQMAAGKFDILFANSCYFFAAPPIGRFVEMPSVLYLQEPFRRLYEARPALPWVAPPGPPGLGFRSGFLSFRNIRNWRLQARAELANAKAVNRILVNSNFSRESVLRSYGLDSTVCYLGIDLDHFAASGVKREGFVVGLGSFTREKGLKLCIEALGRLGADRPKLVWIGNYAAEDYLAEMRALAIAKGVVFESLLCVSDVLLLDTLSRATAMLYAPRLEPFGLAPLEANACGVPVIAVAEGGVRETIIDGVNGLIVESDPAAMAAGVARLCTDPALAARLGAGGRAEVAAKWSYKAAASRLEAQLMEIARRREVADAFAI